MEGASSDASLLTYIPLCMNTPWHKFKTLLDLPTLLYINSHLSSQLRYKWRLLFSNTVHGENFSLLVKHIIDQGPSIIIVRDHEGHVFGGFASEAWSIRPQFVGMFHTNI